MISSSGNAGMYNGSKDMRREDEGIKRVPVVFEGRRPRYASRDRRRELATRCVVLGLLDVLFFLSAILSPS